MDSIEIYDYDSLAYNTIPIYYQNNIIFTYNFWQNLP